MTATAPQPTTRTRAATLVAAAGLLFLIALAMTAPASAQQRNPRQTIGETVFDRESAHYRFERFLLESPDGERRWRINLGIPKRPAPASGFPSIHMVDGNAALMEFDDALLKELADSSPQVLVFIGYDNELRTDTPARTRDYTPRLPIPGGEEGPPLPSGGADAFLDLIERRVKPEVARRVPVDPQRQALWGHSFGGLFVLQALFQRTGMYQTYVAASPSLWWGEGWMLGEVDRFAAHNAGRPARVLIMLGGGERYANGAGRDLGDPRVQRHLRRVAAAPPDSCEKLSARLDALTGIDAGYREFPGLGHGPMLRASLLAMLHAVAGIADNSSDPRPGATPDTPQ